jgi:hypothetical protein
MIGEDGEQPSDEEIEHQNGAYYADVRIPRRMVFELVRERDYVQRGEWFLPPYTGAIEQNLLDQPTFTRHPIYRLVEES